MFKRILFVSGILILGMVIGNFFFSDTLADNQDDNSKHKDAIAYPQNEKGQTYGSALDTPSYEDEPDLIKAYGVDGTIGYVKKEDLDGPEPKTPEEAVRLSNEAKPREIPLYDVDGETIIGKFIVGG
ncbi:peptidase M56 BlaR1 [Halalkalibacter flavus]|uniref:peptidase M56 BlaR1 n=1 Tax=Halalkalibacter flavus TaxID=3090668 RepID=UPI002FCADB2F